MRPAACAPRRHRRVVPAAAVLLPLFLPAPLALYAAAQDTAGQEVRALDEVTIEGHRGLRTLRAQMIRLEDRFYARYNDLNTEDRFDIHCDETASTGSLVKHRRCAVVFESRAREDEGQRHHRALLHAMPNGPGGATTYATGSEDSGGKEWIAPVPAIVAITMQRDQFKATMTRVTQGDAELVELLRQRQELADRYEKMRRRVSGGDQAPAKP